MPVWPMCSKVAAVMALSSRKQRRRERRAASLFCLKGTSLGTAFFVAGVVLLSLTTASLAAPLPSIVFVVDKGANGFLLFSLLTAGLALLGHTVLAGRWSLEELWRLLLIQLLSAPRIPPPHIARPSPKSIPFFLAARLHAAQLTRRISGECARLRPPSKAPFRLFQYAPLLTAP